MGATFVVTLREAFEAALILGIVYTYLDKVGGRGCFRYATVGGALGVVASIAAGVVVSYLSGPLLDLGPDLVATVVIFAAVGLLTWHGWWMRQHARGITGDVQRRIDDARARRRFWIVALIAFTGVFREGAETVLFLWGLLAQFGATSGAGAVVGGVLGVGTATVLGWLVFRGGTRLSLRRFFTVTSVVLLFISAGLFSAGIGKLQGMGFLPASGAVWDTSWLVGDDGIVGGFMAGLVGYRARPTGPEVAAYVAYVVFAAALFFSDSLQPRRPAVATIDESDEHEPVVRAS